ncbi:MAG: hypothetical protein ACPHGV_10725 [Synechococcus sp.]
MVASPCCRRMDLRLPMACLCGALAGLLGTGRSAEALDRKDLLEQMRNSRPADLQVLVQEPDAAGTRTIGIYAIQRDPMNPDLRRYSLWEETPADLNVYVESVRCAPKQPLRVKRTGGAVYVRTLNPGGPIHATNREDHLIWWAACVPDVAGSDPSTLRQKALDLGYSTLIPERQEQLPALAP